MGWIDTIIPFFFIFPLSCIINSINKNNVIIFSITYTVFCIFGFCAYHNAVKKLINEERTVIILYEKQFGKELGQCLCRTVVNFEKISRKYFAIFSISSIILSWYIFFLKKDFGDKVIFSYVFLLYSIITTLIMFNLDIIKKIKKLHCIA